MCPISRFARRCKDFAINLDRTSTRTSDFRQRRKLQLLNAEWKSEKHWCHLTSRGGLLGIGLKCDFSLVFNIFSPSSTAAATKFCLFALGNSSASKYSIVLTLSLVVLIQLHCTHPFLVLADFELILLLLISELLSRAATAAGQNCRRFHAASMKMRV